MDEVFVIAVPVVAFFYTLLALVKTFSDHRIKTKLIQHNASPETARIIVTPSSRRDLFFELKWGIVTIFIGAGVMAGAAVAAAEPLDADLSERLAFGLVMVSAGVGLLVYYAIAARMVKRGAPDEVATTSKW